MPKKKLPDNQIAFYQSPDGSVNIEVLYAEENIWLTQKKIAELFDKDVRTVNEHIKNMFFEGELTENSVIRKFRIVQKEGGREVTRDIEFYNLDVIISVGYRVKSLRGTQFRIWATQKLRDYIIKGFAMDDERLAEGRVAKTYFEEWEERIRKIRTSEANFYQKVRDVFATFIIKKRKTNLKRNYFRVSAINKQYQFFFRSSGFIFQYYLMICDKIKSMN